MKRKIKIPYYKRLFDILASLTLIILLSPLFLLVAILIKAGSKGPIIYYSYRVGMNYKIFKFYKFRSMVTNADALKGKLSGLNQYGTNQNKSKFEIWKLNRSTILDKMGKAIVVCDDYFYGKNGYETHKADKNGEAFEKFKNDPRITKIGKLLRNTSIDELPQLFNVLIGDMSIIGNRPLPLSEAEKLTNNSAVGRFLSPAGITGLWQVTERGKPNVCSTRRVELDIAYAMNYSFWMDIKILLKTLPAAFQHENV